MLHLIMLPIAIVQAPCNFVSRIDAIWLIAWISGGTQNIDQSLDDVDAQCQPSEMLCQVFASAYEMNIDQ